MDSKVSITPEVSLPKFNVGYRVIARYDLTGTITRQHFYDHGGTSRTYWDTVRFDLPNLPMREKAFPESQLRLIPHGYQGMSVKLKLKHNRRGHVVGGSIEVLRNQAPRLYSESSFWHQLKLRLMAQGYDVIKKLMWKDGHLKADTEYYVRSRKWNNHQGFMISQNDNQIRAVYEAYNRGDSPDLSVDPSREDN